MSESLFTDQIPASHDNTDGTPGIVTATGMYFKVPGRITHVRFYAGDSVAGDYTVVVWEVLTSDPNGTGEILANKFVTTQVLPGWNDIQLDNPVVIEPLTKVYKIGMHNNTGRYVATNTVFENSSLINGDIVAPQTGTGNSDNPATNYTIFNGTYHIGATSDDIGYPANSFRGTSYFIDVIFEPDSNTPGLTVSVWDGSVEHVASISVWNGTTEVPANVSEITT